MTNPDVKVQVNWTSTWFDPAVEGDAAKALIDAGADVIAMLIAAAIGGAIWALGPGLARAEIGVSEIITTLTLNEVGCDSFAISRTACGRTRKASGSRG